MTARKASFAAIPTEAPNPRSADLDRLSTEDLVALTLSESEAAFRACREATPQIARLAAALAKGLTHGGRLVYVGAGTSGRLALLDAVELTPTFGFARERAPVLLAGGDDAVFRAREGAEDVAEDGAQGIELIDVSPEDVVIGVTASGRTPFVAGALEEARRRGAVTGLVCCAPPADGLRADHVVILATGPEVLAGSTRMNAGTATKVALNALSLAAMVRLGKVYGNRMVDVRIGSEKLRDRATRLVEEIGRVSRDEAERALRAADGHAKTAILMVRRCLTATEARRLLHARKDSLRRALGE